MEYVKKTYKTNAITKKKIIEISTQLFYEHGYNDTYFEQIADACKITKPLISYYFKRKSTLAKEVSERYITDIKNSIAFKIFNHYYGLKNYDLQLSTAVEIQMINRLYYEDPKAMRFIRERADTYFDDLILIDNIELYKIHDRRYKLNINRDSDELAMLTYAATSTAVALRIAFDRGDLKCSFEQYSDYATSLHFKLMHINDERIAEILAESKTIIEQMDFKIMPYFKIV